MTDEEILKAAAGITRRRRQQEQEEAVARWKAARERAKRTERAFAEGAGVTWDQYQDIKHYVLEHADD